MYRKIIRALAAASAAIVASPVKLPPQVVLAAKCVVLALGVLEAVDGSHGELVKRAEDVRDEVE